MASPTGASSKAPALLRRTLDSRALARWIAKGFVRFPRRFGWWEILGFTRYGSFEWVRRHALIVGELERIRQKQSTPRLRVMDFGGGGGSLAHALRFYMVEDFYEITLVDIDRDAVSAARPDPPLMAKHAINPAEPLPFRDDAFDVVVSADVFEHIPPESRAQWASELRRVARVGQIHTFPCDSLDGRFDSSAPDRALNEWHIARFGHPERWTAEHIANGVPSLEVMAQVLAPSKIIGIANVDVWLETIKYQFAAMRAWRRMLLGIRYLVRLRRLDSKPPFKGCLFLVQTDSVAVRKRLPESILSAPGGAGR